MNRCHFKTLDTKGKLGTEIYYSSLTLLDAVSRSQHSYDDIMKFIQSAPAKDNE